MMSEDPKKEEQFQNSVQAHLKLLPSQSNKIPQDSQSPVTL